jgi:hypothetical protein
MDTEDNNVIVTKWRPQYGALAIAAYCAYQSENLLLAWRTSPFDHLSWIALLIWCLPIVFMALDPAPEFQLGRIEHSLMGAALFVSLLGTMTSLNALKYLGLAFSLMAIIRWIPAHIIWFMGAASWMPAFGYFAAKAITATAPTNLYLVLALRVAIALTAVLTVWQINRKQKKLTLQDA